MLTGSEAVLAQFDTNGGTGTDTLVLAGGSFQLVGNAFTDFERLEIAPSSFVQTDGLNGFASVLVGRFAFVNLASSPLVTATVSIAGGHANLGPGTSVARVVGSDLGDTLSVYASNRIEGGIDLGGNDDELRYLQHSFFVRSEEPLAVGGTIDAGPGFDRLSLAIDGNRTLDLANFLNFEFLDTGSWTSVISHVRIIRADAFVALQGESDGIVTVGLTNAPAARLWGGDVTLEAGSTVMQFGFYGALFGAIGEAQAELITQAIPGTDMRFVNLGTISASALFAFGNDYYDGRAGTVGGRIAGFAGNDILLGGTGNERIESGFGNDTLDGGAGDDTLTGGAGNDVLIVDSAGDFVIEGAGGGADVVLAFADYALNPDAEVEVLAAYGAAASLTGSALANTLVGNGLANRLSGLAGNDLLQGFGGDDVLLGGDGADILDGGDGSDTLDGGAGDDALQGGMGNDIYVVATSGDFVGEAANGGDDVVLAFVDYTLGGDAAIEVLAAYGETRVLGGSAAANTLVGNGLDNTLSGFGGNDVLQGQGGRDVLFGGDGADTLDGGDGDDTLEGGQGSDRLEGGAGNDVYIVETGGDVIVEATNGGSDIVLAFADYALGTDTAIETLAAYGQAQNLTGSSTANALIGNGLANILTGLGGDDLLNGANGSDRLTGGSGTDLFAITGALDGSTDTLTDFTSGERILLDDAVFAGLATGALAASAFTTGAATTAQHRILYDTTTGTLSYDADGSGSGAAIAFAILTGAPTLSAADFAVF